MKRYAILALLASLLIGCTGGQSTNYPFQPKLLPQEVFSGYWAMLPDQGVYNTLEFKRDGSVTLHRFTCKSPTEFEAKESERYKLETVAQNKVYAHWELDGFHINRLFLKYFELTFEENLDKGKFFRLTQYVPAPIDKRYPLVYAKVNSPKPLCAYPKTEAKAKQYQ